MDSGVARRLYERYAAAAFYVAVRDRDGGAGIGTATHVGDGVFVTARHVLEGNSIDEVGCSESTHIRLPDGTSSREHVHDSTGVWPAHSIRPQRFHATTPPVFHPDPRVDLAAFTLPTLDPLTPWVPLGGHLEDWLGISDFVLWEVVLMGYPPIPLSTGPRLVAARAEVNGLVDLRDAAGTGGEHIVVDPDGAPANASWVRYEQAVPDGVTFDSSVTAAQRLELPRRAILNDHRGVPHIGQALVVLTRGLLNYPASVIVPRLSARR